jgi:hypothetical protein
MIDRDGWMDGWMDEVRKKLERRKERGGECRKLVTSQGYLPAIMYKSKETYMAIYIIHGSPHQFIDLMRSVLLYIRIPILLSRSRDNFSRKSPD